MSCVKKRFAVVILVALMGVVWAPTLASAQGGPPSYEHAYANGRTVTISVKDPHAGNAAQKALGQYFEVIYPIGWEDLTESTPQCNSCDHLGDGDDFFDYHDHVFSGEPSNPSDSTYRPLWQLSLVVPAYTGNAAHDAEVSAAFASYLPAKSAADVAVLLSAKLSDGSRIADLFTENYVFRAAIVPDNAAR